MTSSSCNVAFSENYGFPGIPAGGVSDNTALKEPVWYRSDGRRIGLGIGVTPFVVTRDAVSFCVRNPYPIELAQRNYIQLNGNKAFSKAVMAMLNATLS